MLELHLLVRAPRNESVTILFLRNGWSLTQWALIFLKLTHLRSQPDLAKELGILVFGLLAWQDALLRGFTWSREVLLCRSWVLHFKRQPIRLLVRDWVLSASISQRYHMLLVLWCIAIGRGALTREIFLTLLVRLYAHSHRKVDLRIRLLFLVLIGV